MPIHHNVCRTIWGLSTTTGDPSSTCQHRVCGQQLRCPPFPRLSAIKTTLFSAALSVVLLPSESTRATQALTCPRGNSGRAGRLHPRLRDRLSPDRRTGRLSPDRRTFVPAYPYLVNLAGFAPGADGRLHFNGPLAAPSFGVSGRGNLRLA
jgi:hypothetical protein